MEEVVSSGTDTIHGIIVGQVSPVKSSKKQPDVKYFEGHVQISDGVKTMWLVLFEPTLHCKVEEVQKAKHGVALQNCSFKRSRNNDEFEVHVIKKTSILPSPKKFRIDEKLIPMEVTRSAAALGTIEELKDAVEHQRVRVSGKVQSISAVEQMLYSKGYRKAAKQEVVLADDIYCCVQVSVFYGRYIQMKWRKVTD